MPVLAVNAVPSSRDGYYATNNQFLVNGPKGFSEVRVLDNYDLFVRIDLPGVPRDGFQFSLDRFKKGVIIFADAPKEHKHDSSARKYSAATGLVCNCCEIATVESLMRDGVLRLRLSKKKIHVASIDPGNEPVCCLGSGGDGSRPPPGHYGTDPSDPAWTSRVLQPHPNIIQGPNMAYESKQLQNGGLYLRIDMPGVPKERFEVIVNRDAVMVIGRAPAVGFDSSGRDYGSKVALIICSRGVQARKIKTISKNGVIRFLIPPV